MMNRRITWSWLVAAVLLAIWAPYAHAQTSPSLTPAEVPAGTTAPPAAETVEDDDPTARELAEQRSATAEGLIASALPPEAERFIETRALGNTVGAWIAALVILVVFHLFIMLMRRIALVRLRTLSKRYPTTALPVLVAMADDVRSWCIFLVSLYIASRVLILPELVDGALRVLGIGALALQVLITSRLAIDYGVKIIMHRQAATPDGQPDAELASASGIIRFLATLALGAFVLLLALQNMGVEVTALITGLGIGGIAVALAAQNVLQDIFASLTIVFDKPFLVGDFIVVGEQMGTVERIGIKTTRVTALSGEQLVFSNADLLSSRIQNFKRMQQRRVQFKFGVVYETPAHVLKEVPSLVRAIVEKAINGSVGGVTGKVDRVHFASFGAYSLDFDVVYYVYTSDFNKYMDIQQWINLELFQVFASKGIEFAYPTQLEIVRGANDSDEVKDAVQQRRPIDESPRGGGADNRA